MRELQQTLAWDVSQTPLLATIPDSGMFSQIKGKKAIIRDDNHEILSIVGGGFPPMKNAFLEDTVNQIAEITGLEVKGFDEFNGGKAVLGYLKNNTDTQIAGFNTEEYMVVGNYHSTDRSMFIGTVNKLMRCSNEFGSINTNHRIRHDSKYLEKTSELLSHFEAYTRERNSVAQRLSKWHQIPVDFDLKLAMMERVLNVNENREEISTRMQNQMDQLSVDIERETESMGDNLFALMNGVTYYTTHHRSVKNKVFGNIIGSNSVLNNRAYSFCLDVERKLN